MGDANGNKSGRSDEQYPAGGGRDGQGVKGNERDTQASVAGRLQASGRMAFNAMAANSTMPDLVTGQKASAGPSNSKRMPGIAGETSTVQRTAILGETLRLNQPAQGSTDAFDSFINESPLQRPLSSAQQARLDSKAALPYASFADQEANDGAAVVGLLSRPDELGDVLSGEDDDRLNPIEATRLREALFGAVNSNNPNPCWDDMLNLVPDFLTSPSAASSADAQLHTGTADPAVARSIWLQQWSHVLSSYNAEVWGDLGQLAAEAKRNFDQQILGKQPAGSEGSETKALRRLRLILAHVRGRN